MNFEISGKKLVFYTLGIGLVKLCSKFDVPKFKAINKGLQFDYQNMNMFNSVQCSKKWCSSLFDDEFNKSSEGPIKFDVSCPFV